MQKAKKRFLQVAIVLFIGVNFVLVYIDDEKKVDRIAYISDWSQVNQMDMEEKLHTSGVLAATEANHVYFDPQPGSFNEFLVKEGSQVSAGDALFSYTVDNYYEAESNLIQEADQIEGEIAAIQQAITQMRAYQIPQTNTEASPSLEITSEEMRVEFPQDPIQANLVKEQYIVEKEKELAQKNAALTSINNQLQELQTTGDTITVESPYEGRVASVSSSLQDPIITIESASLHAEGELTEQERTLVQAGLPVEISISEKDISLEGTINHVSDAPKGNVTVKDDSIYPFAATFELDEEEANMEGAKEEKEETVENPEAVGSSDTMDQTEEKTTDGTEASTKDNENQEASIEQALLPGYHADVTIITKSSEQATVLYEDMIAQGNVWKMTKEGNLLKQKVDTGILMNSMLEITSGVTVGDAVAADPESQFRQQATFITPIKWDHSWKRIISPRDTAWYEPFLIGFLSR
ncbi:HlyD family efflux transporter periplasmic adaptor subunit [Agaribacter marinus]|uniref:HlyD family efflux transporter periplasmic adaptor subunit n=1 Tax=Virgibacillus salarius TaxID=447199 RepID=A0A941DYT8_9BACI|nr:HlyD family efflux transporter periplasmic adaptor subunit [Virgibacillus salarius]MBR7798171.1 HlyD family efflux transporter periplasmic adaptor subunit [Virgibacillus salarius]NAZ10879.1 HlyD family efflux transporter periplasmic adaptor subunit [Agaribacter marinus]